jgi:hemoglobin-like flavoprotein
MFLTLAGCGEPSIRERENRRELEALLTAISLQNPKELDKDVKRIEARHASGELSDEGYNNLEQIFKRALAGNWGEAEKQAYALRESTPYFK